MPEAHSFDLIVLGGGPAGLSGANTAAVFGRKAAVIECCEHVGGAGINTGTIPSKSLRESALLLSGWRSRKLLGLEVSVRSKAKLAEFTHHERSIVVAERERAQSRMQTLGVQRFRGVGRFLDPHRIAAIDADGSVCTLRGERILIATGSSPTRPPEFPFEHPRVHDSNEILDIDVMPTSLAVVGAGVIGSEYACTFAALGVEVHLIDGRESLMPHLDADLTSTLYASMQAAGIQFHWKQRVARCEPGPDGVRLFLESGKQLLTSDVLVASGRTSNTGNLDLEKAGLACGERGLLAVDSCYRTCVPHVYAAGDVVGAPALAGTSMEQARLAVCHAFDCFDKQTTSLLPAGIYTIPEMSMVGESERSLTEQGVASIVGRAEYRHSPRGRIIGDDTGFLKLVFRREDMRLVGVHALGEQATELVHIGMVAMLCNAGAELFDRACFNYPTLGDLYKQATYDALLQRRQPENRAG